MTYRLAALLSCCCTSFASAQIVRGTVVEAESGRPLEGVVVAMRPVDDSAAAVRSTLSRANGSYALRARPGRFVLEAKRIGIRRVRTSEFTLGPGETVEREIRMSAVPTRLPRVDVEALGVCAAASRDADRVAALWDDARTALHAVELSLRDSLYTAEAVRYVRDVDARGRASNETRARMSGRVGRPFTSPHPDSLGATGYRVTAEDSVSVYHAVDPQVLLSDAFLRTHCLAPENAPRRERSLVGLGFHPARRAGTTDVSGTMWLDVRSRELRRVDFRYVGAPEPDSAQLGGSLEFVRLTTGAWVLQRWSVRVPASARPLMPVRVQTESSPWVLPRPSVHGLREEGGELVSVAARPPAAVP